MIISDYKRIVRMRGSGEKDKSMEVVRHFHDMYISCIAARNAR